MWISKKSFDNLQEFVLDSRKMCAEAKMLTAELSRDLANKNEQLAQLRTIVRQYSSKWFKITCPNCNHSFDVHTMAQPEK